MKQNFFLFILVLLLAVAGFFVYLQKNYLSLSNKDFIPNYSSSSVTSLPSTLPVKIYFSNEKLNPNLKDCSLVYPVNRTISLNGDPFLQTLNLLFLGPTEQEKAEGYTSVFSPENKDILKNLDISPDGIVYIDLYDIRSIMPEVSSSCGSSQFMKSIEETLKQFQLVKKVIFAINGDPQMFYEWVQLGCSEENNNCDKTPFLKFYSNQESQ
ncbi:MAG: GerMN domain-containing protein [Minisyncoccia bacterium]